jgi:hypothetical protein
MRNTRVRLQDAMNAVPWALLVLMPILALTLGAFGIG